MTQTILRRPEVEHRTGLPTSTLYAKIAAGEFPKPIPLGARAVGWLETDVSDWLESRIAVRDTGGCTMNITHAEDIGRAAEWYASLSNEKRIRVNAVAVIREKFGLTSRQAIEAIREANLVKARAM